MRKKVLVSAYRLNSGGVEVSLISFLNELLKENDIEITLLLDKFEGEYKEDISPKVKIKEISFKDECYNYYISGKNIPKTFNIIQKIKFYMVKIINRILIRIFKSHILENYIVKNKISKDKEEYDLIIDFHGYGYYISRYIALSLNAKKRIIFVHSENISWLKNMEDLFDKFDYFFCVSKWSAKKIEKTYPYLKNKIKVFYNIIDKEKIIAKAEEKKDLEMNEETFNLLTVGRLDLVKGYDLLIEIALKLKEMNIKYVWYIIGKGNLELELKREIKDKNLEKNVILLGMKKNPYIYMKNCDIYIQPSRDEGYGIAIAEARCLNKPIIATNIESFQEQIKQNETGILCEFNSNDFTNKIKFLYENKKFRECLIRNLEDENKENINQTEKDINKIKKILQEN